MNSHDRPSVSSGSAGASLRAFVHPHLVWAMGLSLAINLALLTPSLFMMQVYDRVLVTRSVETLVMLLLLAAVSLAVFGALDLARSRILTLLGMALERRFGPGLLSGLIVAHARRSTAGESDGLKDLATLRGFLSGQGVVALFDAPWALVYLLIIGLFDVRLGLLAAGAAGGLLALTWANHRWMRDGLGPIQEGSRAAARWADRCLHNAEVVTALGMSDAVTQRWAARTMAVQDATLAASARGGRLAAVSRVARQGVQVLMLSAGAWLVIREGATPGVMIATTLILGRALAPVEQLIAGWQALAEARLAHGRLQALLDRTVVGTVTTTLPAPTGKLDVEGLAYAADNGRVLLRPTSFSVPRGEIVAVVGGSGAGKTTLARLLVGVLGPTGGTVRIDGADMRHHDPRRLGAALGYLPQDVELLAGTIAENITRFGDADPDAVVAAARAAGAHELILRFPQGYDTPVGEGGRLLSGGQRQRVALARALYGDPALVVLDEPDASLDAEGEEALAAALVRVRERGATVVAVTQRRHLLSVADRVLMLRDGAIERTAVLREAKTAAPAPDSASRLPDRATATEESAACEVSA